MAITGVRKKRRNLLKTLETELETAERGIGASSSGRVVGLEGRERGLRSLSPSRCVRAGPNSPATRNKAARRLRIEHEMTDIFQEVDEEVRRDKAAELWKKYQNYIIGAALLIVLASAGFRYWEYQKERAAQAAGEQLQAAIAAFDAGKPSEAFGGLAKLAADAPGGYRILAQMTEAGAKASTDPAAAIAAFQAIAGNGSVDPLFRDAAKLRAALLQLNIPGEEAAGTAALTSLASADGPYRRLAKLTLGALAIGRGDTDDAGKQLDNVLGDPEVSPTERQLAERWLALVASNRPPK